MAVLAAVAVLPAGAVLAKELQDVALERVVRTTRVAGSRFDDLDIRCVSLSRFVDFSLKFLVEPC